VLLAWTQIALNKNSTSDSTVCANSATKKGASKALEKVNAVLVMVNSNMLSDGEKGWNDQSAAWRLKYLPRYRSERLCNIGESPTCEGTFFGRYRMIKI
jgi:hypothetical protein